MAKKQFLDESGLAEFLKGVKGLIPQLISGDNITLTPDETNPNKITISTAGGAGKIDNITANGAELPIVNKTVNIEIQKLTAGENIKFSTPDPDKPNEITISLEDILIADSDDINNIFSGNQSI